MSLVPAKFLALQMYQPASDFCTPWMTRLPGPANVASVYLFLYFLFLPTMLYRLSEEISRKSPFLSHLKSNHKGNYCNPVEVYYILQDNLFSKKIRVCLFLRKYSRRTFRIVIENSDNGPVPIIDFTNKF